MLSKEILDILACPKCKNGVAYDRDKQKLVCSICKIKFNVLKGDIPDMLLENAKKI